jgi:transcription elongation factor GreA
MANENLVSQDGYEKMKKELEELKGPERSRIAEAIREAKAHGDLRENAAYHEAKLNQSRLESRIAELEKAVQLAKVIERPKDGSVHFGSKVTLLDMEFDDEFEVMLVGAFESDANKGYISINSPLGEALVGQEIGAEIRVQSPSGEQRYKIVKAE